MICRCGTRPKGVLIHDNPFCVYTDMPRAPDDATTSGTISQLGDRLARAEDTLRAVTSRLDSLEQPLHRRRNMLGGLIAVVLVAAGYSVANVLDNGHLAAAVHSGLGTDLALEQILKDSGKTRFGEAVDNRIQRYVVSAPDRSRLVFASTGYFQRFRLAEVDEHCTRRVNAAVATEATLDLPGSADGPSPDDMRQLYSQCERFALSEPEPVTIPLLARCTDRISIMVLGYTSTQYARAATSDADDALVARRMSARELKKYILVSVSEADVTDKANSGLHQTHLLIENVTASGGCGADGSQNSIEDILISASKAWLDEGGPDIAVRVFVLVNWDPREG